MPTQVSMSELFSWACYAIAQDNSHGYSQPNRFGIGGKHTHHLGCGEDIPAHRGDYDCSSMVDAVIYECLHLRGVDTKGFGNGFWTGNECSIILQSGYFREVSPYDTVDGDVLWRSGHTEMRITVGGVKCQCGARRSEYHSITGRTGDQDGGEITWSRFVPSAWSRAFHYTGPDGIAHTGDFASNNGNPAVTAAPKPAAPKADPAQSQVNSHWICGARTTRMWQQACGTYVDGCIDGQPAGNHKYRPNVSTCIVGSNGSMLVRHVQAKVGVATDGLWGYNTSGGIQAFLKAHGFDPGEIDHIFGSHSVHALWLSLNEKPDIWR